MSTTELYNIFMQRRKMLLPEIFNRTRGQVISGPFRGMAITPNYCWGDGDTAGKLLGLYENELYDIIEKEIAQNHDLIVNYGCAEGFYGVGMAMRCPESAVFFIDIAASAIDVAGQNAKANQLVNVEFLQSPTPEQFSNLLNRYQNPFIIMDCEGFEVQMLNPTAFPDLKKSTILVETHDCLHQGITEHLYKIFDDTHEIEYIIQGTKNLYIDPIHDFSDIDKMILNNENRPSTMGWLYMKPWSSDESL